MKKLIILSVIIFFLTGCQPNGQANIGVGETKLKVTVDKILNYETESKNGVNFVRYYYAGDIITNNIYKVDGINVAEDISKRTKKTETYCGEKNCILKQYLSDTYVEGNITKLLLSATTTLETAKGFTGDVLGDSSDVNSTNNKNNYMTSWNTTYNNGSNPANGSIARRSYPGISRSAINFTMSSGTGTISAVKLYLRSLATYTEVGSTEAHELTGSGGANWTEDGICWAYYTGATAWTTAGGDFSATVIHSITDPELENWGALILLGTGSTNPLTLTWGSTVNLLLKQNDETGSEHGWAPYFSGALSGYKPYIEITYSADAITPTFYNPTINIIQ